MNIPLLYLLIILAAQPGQPEKHRSQVAANETYNKTVWGNTALPKDSKLKKSKEFGGITFTGRYASYTEADTWYITYGPDGKMYSDWTDGSVNGEDTGSPDPRAAVIEGPDPLHLSVEVVGDRITHGGANGPVGHYPFGRYPCGQLIYNGIWYYGTYLLEQNDRANYVPNRDWPILQPFVGLRVSDDFGQSWYDKTEPENPLFENPHDQWINAHNVDFNPFEVMIGAPHFVDFGENLENAPVDPATGRKWAYMVAHGADAGSDLAHNSWISGDNVYLIRILMPEGTDKEANFEYVNTASNWQYLAKDGSYKVWNRDNLQEVYTNIKPIVHAPGYLGNVGLTYDAPLGKFIMALSRVDTASDFNTLIFEADAIDGKYKVIQYMKGFAQASYFMNIPSRFISEDGRTMWLCYSSNYWRAPEHLSTIGGSCYALCLTEITLDGKEEASGNKYEAEGMARLGHVALNIQEKFSNGAGTKSITRIGDGVEFISRSSGNTLTAAVYHEGNKGSRQISVYINGKFRQKLQITPNGNDNAPLIVSVPVKIKSGDKVALRIDHDDIAFNRVYDERYFGDIDYVVIGDNTQQLFEDPVKTTFQTSSGWREILDNRADAVMVYGPNNLESRLQSWKEKGYKTDYMTGIAWGHYEDYFTGEWDGKTHFDEGQVRVDGTRVDHSPTVPYIVPTLHYLEYFKEEIIKKAIDAGITDIFLEEPEFWAYSGYSESFKREWQEYYGSPWQPQDSSPEATYLSNKLKYYLYYRALQESFEYAKEYGRSKGLDVKCYVPTHSLINYSQWQIVSPEASLASMDCLDGYIAQVWTGTSRTPIYYDGEIRERTFETAFFEYGCMSSMTAPTGRKMFFLTDPIEDVPRDWPDYKRNYEATFTAQLLHPETATYEVMPWPERIYGGKYHVSADSEEMAPIPPDFATQMQVMINTLNFIPLSDNKVSGAQGIGVLMANSMMFQRFPTHENYDDPALSNFFGQALPLLQKGIPAQIVHIENVGFARTLADTRVLLMSYANMKPLDPEAHTYLAQWVKDGGSLIYSGRDDDPFQTVKEWWNTGENAFAAPSDHLFSLMGIEAGAKEGTYTYGNGKVIILRHDPKEYVLTKGGDAPLLAAVSDNYGENIEFKNSFCLRRGPYVIAATLKDSVSDDPLVIKGNFVDLYDPSIPVIKDKTVAPDTQSLLFDLSTVKKGSPCIIASAARAYEVSAERKAFSFVEKGPAGTQCITRVYLPWKPSSVNVDGTETFDASCWDKASHTYLVRHPNSPDGVRVKFLR